MIRMQKEMRMLNLSLVYRRSLVSFQTPKMEVLKISSVQQGHFFNNRGKKEGQ